VINETSDNPGGGAPGDGTHLLRAMLEARLDNACFGFIADPETAEAAHRAGVGAEIDVALGGKSDELHGEPLRVRAQVRALTDGRFALTHMLAGVRMNLGRSARLVIQGVDVIVTSASQQTFDPEVFLLHGIDVRRYRIVALKSSNHFRAGFQDLAKEIVTADPPGLTTHHIEVFPRKRSPRPLWPLDAEAHWD
jgi:microcystin degradation protein MlrC